MFEIPFLVQLLYYISRLIKYSNLLFIEGIRYSCAWIIGIKEKREY
jgi:hypothetical protein